MAETVTIDNGSLTDFGVTFGAGASDDDTQRVILASDDPAVTSLAIIDDWDESDRAKVNLVVGQAGVPAGNGTAATSLRVTIASDSTGQVAVASLPASTNTIEVVGDVASGSAASGNPVRVGVVADSTVPSAVTDGQIISPWATLRGAQVVAWNETLLGPFTPTIDTAVYADGDRLGSVVEITNAANDNGGSGIITAGRLYDDAASNFSIEAHFWQVSPTLANADNGVFDLTDANLATGIWLGCIDFWSANTKAFTSNRVTQGTYLGGLPALRYTCGASTTSIYMVLRARGAYDAAATDDLVLYFNVIRL